MKNRFPFLILLALTFSLAACNGKTEAMLENTSANGKVKVKLTAKRSSALDPFKAEITVKAYDFKEGKLLFEIMAADLNNENVKFNWKDDNNCLITIEESDKHVRSFQLLASENQVQLAEI
ncbi:MAG: hypothetical protein KA149_12070 [Chitinophagales bacterium]|jgi:hypothetical protein|nr:hypothetical protein [Chitinophagales bacterium]